MIKTSFTVLVSLFLLCDGIAQSKRITKAKTLLQRGEYEKALSKITKTTQHRKTVNLPEAWQVQGEIYQALAQHSSEDSSHIAFLEQAIASYHQAEALSPPDSTAATQSLNSLWSSYFNKAQQLMNQHQLDDALASLARAHMVRPHDTSTYLAQGDIAMQQQNYSLAEQTYTFLLDSLHYNGRQLYDVYNTLVDVYSLQDNDLAKIQPLLKRAQRHFPDSTHWIDREFALLTGHQKLVEAEQLIKQAPLSKDNRITYYRELAHQQRIRHEIQQALYYYQEVLELDEQNLEVLYDLAYLHQEEAIAAEKGIGQDRISNAERQKQALFHYRESLRYLTQAVAQDQSNRHTLQNITLVKTHIGSLEKM